ncbi:MAG: murein biosynthesis integral membrane protein MurJ [FCB group bacterium]|jgi:putative peptidoglycan lipid II flippase|nr:murein biosynthesis integral membrane protein MurJ [FCB group bacterium]
MTKPGTASAGKSIGIAAAMLAISALLSRILGLGREVIIAGYFGAGPDVDAYRASFTLPDLLNYLIAGGALSITFVPMFLGYMSRDDERGGWRLFSTVISTMGLLFVAFTLLAEALAPQIVAWLNPGFRSESVDPQTLALAVTMTRIVLPAQLAFYVGGLIQSTLFARGVFWPAAVSPLIYNLGIILGGVFLSPWFGIQGFSIGVLIGAVLGPLCVPLWAARNRIRFQWSFAPRDPGFIEYLLLSLPLMIGVSLVTVDEWFLRYFASSDEGAIALLGYSRTLMMVLFAMLGQATGQAALPYLTRLYQEGRGQDMERLLAASAQRIGFFAVLAATALAVMAEPVIRLIYERGRFSPEDTALAASYLIPFACGLAGWSLQVVIVRGFYARKDTLTPMLIGTAVAVAAVPLYWSLFHAYGPWGLAVASSLGVTANAVLTAAFYRWHKGPLPVQPIFAGLARGIAFAIPCGIAAHYAAALPFPPTLSKFVITLLHLSAMSLAYGIVFLILAFIIRPPEFDIITARLKRRLSRP